MIEALAIYAENFCKKHLIANDPWPYAEDSADMLVRIYRNNRDASTLANIKSEVLARLSMNLSIEDRMILSALAMEWE